IEQDRPERAVAADASGESPLTAVGIAKGRHIDARIDGRELIGSRDPQVGASRVDSRDGLTQIVIPDERCPNQLLKLFVLENLKPFQIRQRTGIRRRRRRGRLSGATEGRRRLDDRPTVFWADGTARQQTHNDKSNYQPFLHGMVTFFKTSRSFEESFSRRRTKAQRRKDSFQR